MFVPFQGTTNFAIVSGNATKVSLVLFLEEDLQNGKSTIEIDLDPNTNKTGDIWHIALPGLQMGLLYGKHFPYMLRKILVQIRCLNTNVVHLIGVVRYFLFVVLTWGKL